MHIVEIARLLLHFGEGNTIVLRKLSRSTVLVSERGCCVEVNKDGAEASAKKTRRVSRIHSIASQGASISGSVRYYGTSLESAECSEQHTHTHSSKWWMGGGDPKTKQCLLSLQFSFHSLYCYYSIEPRQPAGEYQRGRVWGVLPASAGCMNNIFGHNGKQSIGRLICSGPRIGSNRTWLPSRPSQLGTADHSRSLEVSLLSHLCQLGTESNIPPLLKIVYHTQAS